MAVLFKCFLAASVDLDEDVLARLEMGDTPSEIKVYEMSGGGR